MAKTFLLDPKLEVKTTIRKTGESMVQQTQSRLLKQEVMKKIKALLEENYDMDMVETGEGIIMLVANDDLGSIPFAFDVKVKSLDFDYEAAEEQYKEKLEARQEREAKKAAK